MDTECQQAPLPQVRRIAFEFPDDIPPVWKPDAPEWSALLNGISLTMPHLEPFLIRAVRAASQTVANPYVRAEADAFMAQEGQHFRAHRRFNDLLKNLHYPRLAKLEADMAASYERLDTQSLRRRMAYTVGFESMTIGLTRWLVTERVRLFGHVDTRIVSVMLWHMVEEIEHKCVAFDVYQANFSGSLGGYLARVAGIVHAALHVVGFSARGAREMLRADGRWSLWHRWNLLRWVSRLGIEVAPSMLRAAMPGHDPRKEADPQWVRDWLDGYSGSGIPLVDTAHPDMPVPFPAR